MYDAGKIIIGLAVFLVLATIPIWYNLASGEAAEGAPELEILPDVGQCVAPKEFMRTSHMVLLDQWRNEVVRHGRRMHVTDDGRRFEISLSGTCMKCHSNKARFCDRCHDYTKVDVYCWDCHIEPGGID